MKLAVIARSLTGALAFSLKDVDAFYRVADENEQFTIATGNFSNSNATFDVQLKGISLYDYVGLVANGTISPLSNLSFIGNENLILDNNDDMVEWPSTAAIACVSADAGARANDHLAWDPFASDVLAWDPFAYSVARQSAQRGFCSENIQYFNLEDDIVGYQYKPGCNCFNSKYYGELGNLIAASIDSKYHRKIPSATCLVGSDHHGLIVKMAFGYNSNAVVAETCTRRVSAATCSWIKG